MTIHPGSGVSWWGADAATLGRVLADQLHAELRRLRQGDPGGPPPWLWDAATRLDEGGTAAIDSLDLLALSAATAELVPDAGIGPGLLQARCFGAWCAAVANSITRPPKCVVFRSSGSTGAPRRTTHDLARIEMEAAALAGLIGSGRRRVLSVIPAQHAYGFIHAVLLPRVLGGLPVIDLRGSAPAELPALLQPGDLVLGHPLFWGMVLRGLTRPLPADVIGVTSSAPCPDETALALVQAGLARLLQVYGSAEIAGIGWRDDPARPYTLLPGWQRAGSRLQGGTSLIDPPDLLRWEGADQFHVLGRRDGAVQVGGINVLPSRVADALRAHPAVQDVTVRAMRLGEGERLKAFIVPAPDAPSEATLTAALRQLATRTLSPPERPAAYRFGPALPRNPMGKLTDWPEDTLLP
jgi:long-chain acyl-CoA synthetase